MQDFVCVSITPIELMHSGLAVATARAGGVAVLDREFCHDADVAKRHLQKFLALVDQDAVVGLRLSAAQIAASQSLLGQLSDRVHWLVVSSWDLPSLVALQASLPASPPQIG